jgi:hypothetical protein
MAKVQFTEHPLKGYTDTKPEHIAGKETLFMELDIKNGTLDAIRVRCLARCLAPVNFCCLSLTHSMILCQTNVGIF